MRRWLCSLGLHGRIYIDSAMYHHARRCGHCQRWVDVEEGAKVDAEREDWAVGRLRRGGDPA